MVEKVLKKEEKVQEKLQEQQELNNEKDRELTDKEMDQVVGGGRRPPVEDTMRWL